MDVLVPRDAVTADIVPEASGVDFEVAHEVEVQRTGPATPNPDEERSPAEEPMDPECGPNARDAGDYPHQASRAKQAGLKDSRR